MKHALLVKLQTVPLLQDVEDRNCESKARVEIFKNPLPQPFQITNLREQGKHGFDNHSLIARSAPTDFEVRRIALFAAKTVVRVNNHPPVKLFNQRVKAGVGDIRGRRRVSRHQSEFVCHNAELSADNPPPVGQAFFGEAPSFRLSAFSDRMTQLNAEAVSDAQHGRLCQKAVGQAAMRLQAAKQSSAFGQTRKQMRAVLRKPAVESVLRCALEREQQADCRQLAGRKFSFRVLPLICHQVIYAAKQVYDKFFLSHVFNLPCVVFGHLHNRKKIVAFSISTKG